MPRRHTHTSLPARSVVGYPGGHPAWAQDRPVARPPCRPGPEVADRLEAGEAPAGLVRVRGLFSPRH